MIVNTVEKKNEVILNRFESKETGLSANRKYTIQFKDGKTCSMLCMNGETLDNVIDDVYSIFGKNKILKVW